jgi:hypothetical protein
MPKTNETPVGSAEVCLGLGVTLVAVGLGRWDLSFALIWLGAVFTSFAFANVINRSRRRGIARPIARTDDDEANELT